MDRIEKYRSIFQEMAFSRKEIISEIRSSNRTRNKHLLLIFYFYPNSSYHHWLAEITADIMDIADKRWKSNNGYLMEEEYFDNLWNKPFENKDDYELVDSYVESLIFENYKFPDNWKIEKHDFVKNAKQFYLKIAKALSTHKINNSIIHSLLEKYFVK